MRTLTLLTLLLASWLFLAGLGGRELYSSHEARAAMNAVSLLAGEPLPRLLDGTVDLQKPPTYYAAVALIGGALGGVDGWAVRLPAAAAGLGIVTLLLGFSWRIGRPRVGLFAALILLATIHFPWLARIGRIDMPLALCVTAAGLSFLLALRGERGWLWLAYPACASGVLLKGPIGLILPGAVVAAALLAEGRWPAAWEGRAWLKLIDELGVVPGVAAVAAVTVPAFLWVEYASGGRFFHEFFWLHNVQRGLGGSRLRSHPWWLYVPYLMLYLSPATPLLAWGLFSPAARRDPLARAGLAWLVGVVVVLSASRFKRADYLLPAYPGAALFLGVVLDRWAGVRPRLVHGAALAAAAGGVLGWAIYLYGHLPAEAAFRDYRPLASLIRSHGGEVVYFRAEAHALMFRVGLPTRVLLGWDRLRGLVTRPQLVVVQEKLLDQVRRELPGVRVEELGGTRGLAGGRHERPLVLLRLSPGEPLAAAAPLRISRP